MMPRRRRQSVPWFRKKRKQDKGKKGGKDEHANMSKRPGGIDILI